MQQIVEITDREILDRALSEEQALIFKHSTHCGISAGAIRKFKSYAEETTSAIPMYVLNIIDFRDFSREIAEQTGIPHQSPQILYLKAGTVVWHESHWSISRTAIEEAVGS